MLTSVHPSPAKGIMDPPLVRSRASAVAAVQAPPSSVEIEAQLERILVSAGFRGSERLKRFLQFAVERALAGQADQLKEFTVGHEVFDRGTDYDPRTDSIVRVEAQRLRKKLREFY